MSSYRWIDEIAVLVIHSDQLEEHGGLPGIRDPGALSSALNRPRNRAAYAESADIADIAAAYGFGLVANHPFVDGNKRTSLATTVAFLRLNDHDLLVGEERPYVIWLRLASGEMDEDALAEWLRRHI